MTWSHPAMESVIRTVGSRTGLTFAPERHASAELGIKRAMTRAAITDPERYYDRLITDDALFDDLVTELTIGETYFFREPRHFHWMHTTLFPDLRVRGNGEQPIRIWSAGCATGEEAYSLAMTCTREGLEGRSHVLATDISRTALARARKGIYTSWSLRGEDVDAARPYLQKVGDRYHVVDAIRQLVTFEHLNLALGVYPSFATATWGVDLILCRNVLIYFDRETIAAVARRLYEALAEGGWLITASSDPPLAREAPFLMTVTNEGVFYQRPKPTRVAVGPPRNGSGLNAVFGSEPALTVRVTSEGSPSRLSATKAHNEPSRSEPRADTDQDETVAHIRVLANRDAAEAERACAQAIERNRFSTELHYLRAALLLNLGRMADAARAARHVIYLDRNLTLAHFLLGTILQQQGHRDGARRAYRNARDLASKQPPDEAVLLAEGETAGRLADRAAAQLARLAALEETRS